MIKLVRVDHRLLHGQVIFSWTKQLAINYIIIADDKVPNDPLSIMALSIAKPVDCELSIVQFNKVKEIVDRKSDKNIMILVKGPGEAVKLIEKLPEIKEINYGGIAKKSDSKVYGKAVFLNDLELKDTRTLLENNIKIFVQQVPTSNVENVDFMK
ncbi:MAG: PTS sugar transporter subunit IIB [Clostridium sp.]|uniref:PTS sugar transporter subunit IIB n=1 Tax=Clostridium TaxID=1485 RepID=UPI0026EEEA77|nr:MULTISPECIES: PTS sugar transporter subunit IIB [Clostridium]MBS7130820.1 PTS sugar transporter subunit IIB [Clostridium sp.]MDU2283482.1 PTS sugar transporter subunit IIB [Clostridium sp.]MDU6808593.1 PTS sugar transporter subunit IIB [Clostridium sp.]